MSGTEGAYIVTQESISLLINIAVIVLIYSVFKTVFKATRVMFP